MIEHISNPGHAFHYNSVRENCISNLELTYLDIYMLVYKIDLVKLNTVTWNRFHYGFHSIKSKIKSTLAPTTACGKWKWRVAQFSTRLGQQPAKGLSILYRTHCHPTSVYVTIHNIRSCTYILYVPGTYQASTRIIIHIALWLFELLQCR